MFKKFAVAVFGLFMSVALTPAIAEEGDTYLQVEVISHLSRNKAEQRSLLGKIVYGEKEYAHGLIVFGQLYHDEESRSAFVGVSKRFGGFQIGFGAGPERHANRTRMGVTSWLFYSNEEHKVEGILYNETYRGDPVRFYRGSLHKTFENGVIAGLYGESFAGMGPLFGCQLTKEFSVRAMVPTTFKPDGGGVKALVLIKYVF